MNVHFVCHYCVDFCVFQVLKVKQRLGFHTPTPIHTVTVIDFSKHCQCVWKKICACSLNLATVVLTFVVSSTETETAETGLFYTPTPLHTRTLTTYPHMHTTAVLFSALHVGVPLQTQQQMHTQVQTKTKVQS